MKIFIRLNILSALYGLLVCVFHILYSYKEVLLSISPLSKMMSLILLVGGFILLTILSLLLFYHLTGKWLQGNIRFLSVLLWFPYYLLLNYILFLTVIPSIPHQYERSPGDGFVVLFLILIFPILIGMINLFAKDREASIH